MAHDSHPDATPTASYEAEPDTLIPEAHIELARRDGRISQPWLFHKDSRTQWTVSRCYYDNPATFFEVLAEHGLTDAPVSVTRLDERPSERRLGNDPDTETWTVWSNDELFVAVTARPDAGEISVSPADVPGYTTEVQTLNDTVGMTSQIHLGGDRNATYRLRRALKEAATWSKPGRAISNDHPDNHRFSVKSEPTASEIRYRQEFAAADRQRPHR